MKRILRDTTINLSITLTQVEIIEDTPDVFSSFLLCHSQLLLDFPEAAQLR